MNTHFRPAREDDTPLGPADSPGRRLRIARQSRGMTQERVAEELHLNPTIIEALEHEDYKSLPEPVFVTGYVRKYARLVGLDSEPLVATYRVPPARARTNNTAVPAGRHRVGTRRIGARHLTLGLIGVGSLLLVGVLVFLWQWYQRPDPGPETTAAEGVARETALADMLDTLPGSELSAFPAADLEDLLADQEMGQSPEPESDPATLQPQPPTTTATREATAGNADAGTIAAMDARPTDTAPAIEETEATIAAKADEIELIFNGPCWVDVRDSEQKQRLFNMMKKGDRYLLEGKPPHRFKLGNAAAVQIMVSGKPLDLSTVSQGNVARFTLDADGKIR